MEWAEAEVGRVTVVEWAEDLVGGMGPSRYINALSSKCIARGKGEGNPNHLNIWSYTNMEVIAIFANLSR